ncbi:uncharacterized protein C8A04DRAFT_25216 [Dichotomopilus funicola]|uniref:Uncharacterized protein n=1 Tax=Dichotomopilus funicola TaxID=1934379 RepID=A0AAN6ZS12_9PEZI|nr:hypothetical protein C8A04DRAFT_25216 [Dichotomopilus funicola]
MNSQPHLAPIHHPGSIQFRYERPGQDRERGRQRRNSKHQVRLRRTIPSDGTSDPHVQDYYPMDHAMITTPPASPVRESIPVFMDTRNRVSGPAPALTNSPFQTPSLKITTTTTTTTHIHSPPPSPSSYQQHLTPQTPTSTRTPTTPSHHQTQTSSSPKGQPQPNHPKPSKEKDTQPPKQKRNNKPYTFEQEAFVVYHRIDLDLPWERVRQAYMARWPDIARSVGGLECAYYRANGRVPDVISTGGDSTGELVLVEGGEREVDLGGCEVRGGSGSDEEDDREEGEGGEEEEGKEVYKVYKGVAYRTRGVKCRKARISLLERFPEELVDERNEWVRAEHRVVARDAAEKRRRQREEWLAVCSMRS